MPRGIYRVTSEPVQPGALVAACLPAELARHGRAHGYLGGGACEGGASAVIKVAAGVGGDRLDVSLSGVRIDGRLLPASAVRSRDRAGRELQPFRPTRDRLLPGEIWLHAPATWSWDSRYFGPVSEAGVLGRVRPVLVF